MLSGVIKGTRPEEGCWNLWDILPLLRAMWRAQTAKLGLLHIVSPGNLPLGREQAQTPSSAAGNSVVACRKQTRVRAKESL